MMAQTSEIFNDQLKYLKKLFCCCFSVTKLCPTLCTAYTAANQSSLSFTISQNFLIFISIDSVLLSNQLILCHSILLQPLIFLSIRVFFNESSLCIRWPTYCSFSFSISPSNEYSRLMSLGLTSFILQSRGLSRVFSSTTIQKHQFFGTQPSLWSNSHIHT